MDHYLTKRFPYLDGCRMTMDLSPMPRHRGSPRRILAVVRGLPSPDSGASSIVFHYYLTRMAQAGHSVCLLLLLESGTGEEEPVAAYRSRMESERFEIRVCSRPAFYRPSRFAPRRDDATVAAVAAAATGCDADLLVCFDIVAAWMAEGIAIADRAVWLGDLNFETMWFHAVYGWREGDVGLVGMVSTISHCWHWRRIYRRVLARFRKVVVCAQSSVEPMADLGVATRFLPYPWPGDSGRPRLGQPSADKPTLLMFGALAGLGSRSAFHMIANELYPRLVERYGLGGFRFVLSGRGVVPAWVTELVGSKAEFEFLGFVEDLEALMDQAHALLAPIDVPVGNRTRILTAMARGLPVIAHCSTALGNPMLVDGETCYLAATVDEFLDRIDRVVAHPDQAALIAAKGRECRRMDYGIDTAADAFLAFIEDNAP